VPCIAWLTSMTLKAALNNAPTSCYSSSLVCNNYSRLYYQISSKLEISIIDRFNTSSPYRICAFRKSSWKYSFVTSVSIKRARRWNFVRVGTQPTNISINFRDRRGNLWMLIVTKNTFTFVAVTFVMID